jgi:hypothetical protein
MAAPLSDERQRRDRLTEGTCAIRVPPAPIGEDGSAARNENAENRAYSERTRQEDPVPWPLRLMWGYSRIHNADHCRIIELVEPCSLELTLQGEEKVGGDVDVPLYAGFLKYELRRAPPLPVLVVEDSLSLLGLLELHFRAVESALNENAFGFCARGPLFVIECIHQRNRAVRD